MLLQTFRDRRSIVGSGDPTRFGFGGEVDILPIPAVTERSTHQIYITGSTHTLRIISISSIRFHIEGYNTYEKLFASSISFVLFALIGHVGLCKVLRGARDKKLELLVLRDFVSQTLQSRF